MSMKVRFVIDNDYGYCHETSIEMTVDAIPRIGEAVCINTHGLVKKAMSVEYKYKNQIFHSDQIDCDYESSTDRLIVADIVHDYTEIDSGIYVILVGDYRSYLIDNPKPI